MRETTPPRPLSDAGEHRGLDHKGVMRDCIQEIHFCIDDYGLPPPEPYYEGDGITVYVGDCLDVLPRLAPVDHVITDPPYSRDVYHRLSALNSHPPKSGERLTKLAAGDIGVVDDLIAPVAAEMSRIVRRWGIVFSDAEETHHWKDALELAGMRYVRTGAWVKPDPMPQFSGDRPAVGFEPCTIVHAQGPMRWNGGGHPAVWTYFTAKGSARPDHPCPKPLPLMTEMIQQFTDPGETILDPFMGSGTTLVAARNLGRKAIGIELNEEWAEKAVKRLRVGSDGVRLVERGQLTLDATT